jgi:hypothetical protein
MQIEEKAKPPLYNNSLESEVGEFCKWMGMGGKGRKEVISENPPGKGKKWWVPAKSNRIAFFYSFPLFLLSSFSSSSWSFLYIILTTFLPPHNIIIIAFRRESGQRTNCRRPSICPIFE